MGFYIEQSDRSNKGRLAGEDIKVGTLVYDVGDGTVVLADAETHATFSGVADAPRRAEYIADEIDDTSDFTYKAGDQEQDLSDAGHLVPFGGDADRDIINVRTILETTDTVTTAPSISDGDVVGFVDTSDTNAPTSAGRLVEEGYSNDEDDDTTPTTFNTSNGNFVAVGRAYKPNEGQGDDFDDVVRVEVGAHE